MQIIKEYTTQDNQTFHYCIRSENIARLLDVKNVFLRELQNDFAQLPISADDVDVVQYTPIPYRTFGIEITIEADPPDGYQQVAKLKRKLCIL